MTSGTIVSNTTVQASPATMKSQTMTVAEFHMANHERNYRGADDSHGSLSPATPLNTFVIFSESNRYPSEHADRVVFQYAVIVVNFTAEYQTQFNNCSKLQFTIENLPLSTGWGNHNYSLGNTVHFTLTKSAMEWHDSTDDYWHESVVGWGQYVAANRDEAGDYIADKVVDIGITTTNTSIGSISYNSLFNGLNYCHQEGNIYPKITVTFV